jgi:hypothetical protein
MILEFTHVYDLLGLVDVQFRVKEFDSKQDWEEIKVSFMLPVRSREDAERIARDLIRSVPLIQEVRWNRAGSPKGHFVQNNNGKYPKKVFKRHNASAY